MYREVTDMFDSLLKLEKFDNNKAMKIENDLKRLKLNWVQKDKDHIMFLSSQYTGVYNAVFSQLDMENFFKIFNTNAKLLKLHISKLEGVNPDWNVAINPMYQLCTYLMHKYINLNYKNLNNVLILIYEIMSYAMLTSILYNFFKRKQTIEEAKAAFEKLNYKFLLKKLGSWDSVIKYKAQTVLKDGRFYDDLVRLNTKLAMDTIAAIQTSYKSLIVNIASITHNGSGDKIDTTNMVVNTLDGDTDIRVIENASNYTNYIKSIIPIKQDFINKNLVSIISKRVKNADSEHIIATLNIISLDYSTNKKNDKFIDNIIEYSIEYLNSLNITNFKDLNYVINLKGFWSFGNNKTKPIKEIMKSYAYGATGKKTEWVLNGIIIASIIYIFSRAIIKK